MTQQLKAKTPNEIFETAIQKAMADRINAALEEGHDLADLVYDLRGEFFMAVGLIEEVRSQLQQLGDHIGVERNKAAILKLMQTH